MRRITTITPLLSTNPYLICKMDPHDSNPHLLLVFLSNHLINDFKSAIIFNITHNLNGYIMKNNRAYPHSIIFSLKKIMILGTNYHDSFRSINHHFLFYFLSKPSHNPPMYSTSQWLKKYYY